MSSRRRPVTAVTALVLAACAAAPSSALAAHCRTDWKVLKSTALVDVQRDGAPAPDTKYTRFRFGHLTVYRQPGRRGVCAQVSLRQGMRIDTLQIVQRRHVRAQRNGNLFLFDTLPGTRKRFSVGVVARGTKGHLRSDTERASL